MILIFYLFIWWTIACSHSLSGSSSYVDVYNLKKNEIAVLILDFDPDTFLEGRLTGWNPRPIPTT